MLKNTEKRQHSLCMFANLCLYSVVSNEISIETHFPNVSLSIIAKNGQERFGILSCGIDFCRSNLAIFAVHKVVLQVESNISAFGHYRDIAPNGFVNMKTTEKYIITVFFAAVLVDHSIVCIFSQCLFIVMHYRKDMKS